MPVGGTPHNSSLYHRVITLIDKDGETVLEVLNDRSQSIKKVGQANFEWRRFGGCGSGNFEISRSFMARGAFEVGQYIRVQYTNGGDNWYLGRIEEVQEASPAGVSLRTEGLMSVLNDLHIGGKDMLLNGAPQLFARKPRMFRYDLDLRGQIYNSVDNILSLIEKFYDQWIATTGIGLDEITLPGDPIDFHSMVFRGEESVSECLRTLSQSCYGASYGVNADGEFFFKARPTTTGNRFQIGVSLDTLSSSQDRSLLYNMIDLVGDYVYTTNGFNQPIQHYRYTGLFFDQDSIDIHGAKRLQLYVPYIRTKVDADRFTEGFFDRYAQAYTRYTAATLGQSVPMYPWDAAVALYDRGGNPLIEDESFDAVAVEFNEAPVFKFTTGPEDLAFPTAPEPQHWEMPPQNGGRPPDWTSDYTWTSYWPTGEGCPCDPGYTKLKFQLCATGKSVRVCWPNDLIKDCRCPEKFIAISTVDSSVEYANICSFEGGTNCGPDCKTISLSGFPGNIDGDYTLPRESCNYWAYGFPEKEIPADYGSSSGGSAATDSEIAYLWIQCGYYADAESSGSGADTGRFVVNVWLLTSPGGGYYSAITQFTSNYGHSACDTPSLQPVFSQGWDTPGGPLSNTTMDSTVGSASMDVCASDSSSSGENVCCPPQNAPDGECLGPPTDADITQYNADKDALADAVEEHGDNDPIAIGQMIPKYRCWAGLDGLVPQGHSLPSDSFGTVMTRETGTGPNARMSLVDLQEVFTALYEKHYPPGVSSGSATTGSVDDDDGPSENVVFLYLIDNSGSINQSQWPIEVHQQFLDWIDEEYPDVEVVTFTITNYLAQSERWIHHITQMYLNQVEG